MMPTTYAYIGTDTRVHLSGSKMVSVATQAREPDLSKDGKQVVFWTGDHRLWIKDLTTGKERTLRRGNVRSPRFSPDGRTVCFTEFVESRWSLYAMSAAGGAPKLLQNGGDVFMPVWQDDGYLYAQVGGKFAAMNYKGEIERPYPVEASSSSDNAVEGPDGTLYFTKEVETDLPVRGDGYDLITVLYQWTPTEDATRVSPPKTSLQNIRLWNGGLIGEGTNGKQTGIFWSSFDGKQMKFLHAGSEPGT